jgi:uncharacterized protein YijF (DUF1287 family)
MAARLLWLPVWLVGLAHAQALPDRGIFPDLTARVQTRVPAWLARVAPDLRADAGRRVATLFLGGLPVKAYALQDGALSAGDRAELAALAAPLQPQAGRLADADGDGIPDPVDVLWGARKAVLNGDAYTEGYVRIPYPNGDVPRNQGVCTDVVVRALRNAGLDLQQAVYRDMAAHPERYGLKAGEHPDPNIDHRRVRRLIRYFTAHFVALPAAFDPAARGRDAWLPGDIVFMDTFPSRPGPDHVGLVSDQAGPDGRPLIINNWTDGYTTRDMDLLSFVPVTHRFRIGLTR